MDELLFTLTLIAIFALAAVGLDLVMGAAGRFSVAQALFMATGAYGTGILYGEHDWPLVAAFVAAVGCATALGIAFGIVATRIRGDEYLVLSLGLQVIGIQVLTNWTSLSGGADGLAGVPFFHGQALKIAILAAWGFVLLSILLIKGYLRLTLGLSLLAVRDDSLAARSIGIRPERQLILAFAMGGALAGLAGAFYAPLTGYVDPGTFTLHQSVFVVAMVMLGGTGRVWGAAAGALFLIGVPDLIRRYSGLSVATSGYVEQVIYGGAILFVVMLLPGGIGQLSDLSARGVRRAAALVADSSSRRTAKRG